MLLEEVYHQQTIELSEAAKWLSNALPPLAALNEWLNLFVDYVATKQIIVAAFAALLNNSPESSDRCARLVGDAVTLLTTKAVESGDIELDLSRWICCAPWWGPPKAPDQDGKRVRSALSECYYGA